MEFKERVQQVAKDNGISVKEMAKILGVSYSTLQNYIGGISPPKVQFYQKVCEKFGVSANWLLMDIGPMYADSRGRPVNETTPHADGNQLVEIRRYNVEASAGPGSAVPIESETGSYGFKREWLNRRGLKPSSLSVISVSGNSMEPDLYDGDLVLIDHATIALGDGHIYAVRFSDGLYVKRIQHQPGDKVLLISKNKDYPPIEITHPVADGVEVIGRIVASMHEW